MQIHKLLIPATTYMHTYKEGHPFAVNGPVEMSQEAEVVTCTVQPVAFCTTITFACDEQIIVLNIGYGHSISFVCYRQQADSASEEKFRYEYVSKDVQKAIEDDIVNAICKMITHSEIFKQHQQLIYNFVKNHSF